MEINGKPALKWKRMTMNGETLLFLMCPEYMNTSTSSMVEDFHSHQKAVYTRMKKRTWPS